MLVNGPPWSRFRCSSASLTDVDIGADRSTQSTEPVRRGLPTVRLFGYELVAVSDIRQVSDAVLAATGDDVGLPLLVTPNVDNLVRLGRPENQAWGAIDRRARYALPDGQPLVWASRLAGRPLPARLPGSSLFTVLWNGIVDAERSTVAVVPSAGVGDGLRKEYPAARIVVAPMFDPHDERSVEELAARCWQEVADVRAEFVFVGIGTPKQQALAAALLRRYPELAPGASSPLLLLLGGSFSMHLGLLRRAPSWMQRIGAEWLFRFLLEPRRLFRRYFVDDLLFLPKMLGEALRVRLENRRNLPTRPGDGADEQRITQRR